jgi:hypothetical protein
MAMPSSAFQVEVEGDSIGASASSGERISRALRELEFMRIWLIELLPGDGRFLEPGRNRASVAAGDLQETVTDNL